MQGFHHNRVYRRSGTVNSSTHPSATHTRRSFLALSGLAGSSLMLPPSLFAGLNQAKYRVVESWPEAGCPRVQCRGIDADAQGKIYVAGDAEYPVMIWNRDGKYLGAWGHDVLATPHGVRVQGETVWVTDVQTHMVHQFSLKGKLVRSFGKKGEPGDGPDQFDRPTDFAFGPDGAIYISDGYGNTRVVCLAPDGTLRKIWGSKGDGPGQFNLVHAIAIDGSGRVLVGDRNNSRIQIFDLAGNYKTQWNHVGKPYGLYACHDGSLFVCGLAADGTTFRVLHLGSDGKVLSEFGDTGEGPGQFQMAHSILADGTGNVFVADGKANRVQKFTRV